MIVDAHTHIFPPEIARDRDHYLSSDATFASMYRDPAAKIATAEDLLASMDAAAIDASITLGFAWSDPATCRTHNDYLISSSRLSNGRLIPFCTLPLASGADAIEAEMRRCVDLGVCGFGELRPDNCGFDLQGVAGDELARLAHELRSVLLFHVSEPVGHLYPGKQGLSLASFYAFACAHPDVDIIGAHWAGGLPFYASMPEVKQAFAHLNVDTAASSLLYGDEVFAQAVEQIGAERILFGSDYPLLSQKRSRRRVEEAGLSVSAQESILGRNAARLLQLK